MDTPPERRGRSFKQTSYRNFRTISRAFFPIFRVRGLYNGAANLWILQVTDESTDFNSMGSMTGPRSAPRHQWRAPAGNAGSSSGDRKCSCNSLLTCNRFNVFLWWHFCVLSSLPVSREKRDLVGSAMYAQAPFGHNNMVAAVQCSFHHHHRIMFHLFHYSTSPKRHNIIDTNEHSIEQWKRGFIYYEVRIFNC